MDTAQYPLMIVFARSQHDRYAPVSSMHKVHKNRVFRLFYSSDAFLTGVDGVSTIVILGCDWCSS